MPTPSDVPHVPDALAKSARERFQSRYAEPLTDADGREIATNLLGMFALLQEWREKRDAAGTASSRKKAPSVRRRRSTPTEE